MAAPLSGAGQQPQLPLSQALQPIGNDQTRQVRQDSENSNENEIQPRAAETAQTVETNTQQSDTSSTVDERQAENANEIRQASNSDRGGNIDITV